MELLKKRSVFLFILFAFYDGKLGLAFFLKNHRLRSAAARHAPQMADPASVSGAVLRFLLLHSEPRLSGRFSESGSVTAGAAVQDRPHDKINNDACDNNGDRS